MISDAAKNWVKSLNNIFTFLKSSIKPIMIIGDIAIIKIKKISESIVIYIPKR